ncbi:hypothetical protein SmJEL517_g02804 [Synchytrium microbalum]|uniref:Cytochrome b5 heme-binding domain-containing protein n=1 Tax=Synchytrium microbalum TaxID=1806994 RepID=A0A507C4T3_9FUNG|nr:uncharacterized protein SmJEL517_g02804 [Synchytrium microbalum]TPX34491.1 hypothetical protein SmJEL517_g02804 [Synchytrium microbalum]
MSELKQRKTPTAEKIEGESSKDKTKRLKKQAGRDSSALLTIFQVLIFCVLLTLAISHVSTRTPLFGVELPTLNQVYRKFVPAKGRVFKPEELKLYDGSDPTKPIYLAIVGKVYDVSAGRRHYGPDGSYAFFAGRDAGRAYVTGCFQTHLTHDMRGLSEEQLKSLDTWQNFYRDHKEYFYVGEIDYPPIDPNSPIPPPCTDP